MLLVTKIWEQRKLGGIVKFFDNFRKPLKSSDRKKGIYPYYGATGIIDYINDYIFDGEYVLLSEDGANIIDRNYPVSFITKGKFWVNNHAHIMKSDNNSNYFISLLLEKINYIKYNSGSAQPKLTSENVKKITLFIPSKFEQNQLSDFILKLNNLIALYERKVKLLLQIKKYLLNNLFSEKEYPDLRFKYSKKDNWKKISLSSVLTYKNGKAHEKEINNKGNLDLVMMNSITTEGRLITKKKIFSPQDTLSKNDIVIVLSDIAKGELIGKSSVIPCDDQYVLNQRIGCLRPTSNIDSFFVSKYINQKSQYFKSHAAGTSQINLSKSDVLNCTIYIPNIDEQHYVSNFIINIEKNINFYKDKKQCFIEIKNTLLNNMFI